MMPIAFLHRSGQKKMAYQGIYRLTYLKIERLRLRVLVDLNPGTSDHKSLLYSLPY